jgi:hypothetical protein
MRVIERFGVLVPGGSSKIDQRHQGGVMLLDWVEDAVRITGRIAQT